MTSTSGGLYLFFRLPPGSVYLHEGSGGGFGMGYTAGDGVRRCWLSGDGESWNPMDPRFSLAVQPVVSVDKARGDGVLVLGVSRPAVQERNGGTAGGAAELTASPNPFNPDTRIRFSVSRAGPVQVAVFDVRGRAIRTLASGWMDEGEHHVDWDGTDDSGARAASGVYLVRLVADGTVVSRPVIMVK